MFNARFIHLKVTGIFIFFIIFMNMSRVTYAQSSEPADVKFVKLVERVNTYEAQFEQKITDESGGEVSKMQGDIKVLRPGKFYWKSQKPDPILVVADGTYLWTYDIDLEQVTKQDLAKALSASPAAVLIGSSNQLLDTFQVAYVDSAQCEGTNKTCFALKPTEETEMFQDIKLIFIDDKLTEVYMDDALGQHIRTAFRDIKINTALNDSIFKFIPPEGVDVIRPQGDPTA